jgi:hypothetical protein
MNDAPPDASKSGTTTPLRPSLRSSPLYTTPGVVQDDEPWQAATTRPLDQAATGVGHRSTSLNLPPPPQQHESTRSSNQLYGAVEFLPEGTRLVSIHAQNHVINESFTVRPGPILLQWWSLECNDWIQLQPRGVSRGNPALGTTTVTSTCLAVGPQQEGSNVATGLSTGALCIHSWSHDNAAPAIEYYHTRHYHRPTTAVAWQPAASLVAMGSAAPAGGVNFSGLPASSSGVLVNRRGVSLGGGGGANNTSATTTTAAAAASLDREYYGCLIWDVEHQSSTADLTNTTTRRKMAQPLHKLLYQSGVASLAWVNHDDASNTPCCCLAVGSSDRNLHLLDLRTAAVATNMAVIPAHQGPVHGVEPNPQQPHQFATYSRTSTSEPVKLWDARRWDAPYAEIKAGNVQRLRWSSSHAQQTLCVAVSDVLWEFEAVATARPIPLTRTGMTLPLLDFALYPYNDSNTSSSTRNWADLSSKRMICLFQNGMLSDSPRHALAPVAISPRDGRLVQALGSRLSMGSTQDGPAAMEKVNGQDDDISATMMRRSRCVRAAKYSLDPAQNIKMLLEDQPFAAHEGTNCRVSVLRVWEWIERLEQLTAGESEEMLPEPVKWSTMTLVTAGVWNLLRLDQTSDNVFHEVENPSEDLGGATFDSPGRRYVFWWTLFFWITI